MIKLLHLISSKYFIFASETGQVIIGLKKLAWEVVVKMIEFVYSIFNTITRVLFTHTHTVNQGFQAY